MNKTTEEPSLDPDGNAEWTEVVDRHPHIPAVVLPNSGPAGTVSANEMRVHAVNEAWEEESARRAIYGGANTRVKHWSTECISYTNADGRVAVDTVRTHWYPRLGDKVCAFLPPYIRLDSHRAWIKRDLIQWDKSYMHGTPHLFGYVDLFINDEPYRVVFFADEA